MFHHLRGSRRSFLRLAAVGTALGVVVVLASPGLLGSALASSSGNQGTVKVDGVPFDQHQDNEPHPGCSFEITVFDFESGSHHVSYSFDLQPPSGTANLVNDTLDFNGGQGYDATTGSIDLGPAITTAGAFRQQNQGYHVELTVDTGQGAGKHKVFWVDCASTSIPVGAIGFIGLAVILGLGFAVIEMRRMRSRRRAASGA
jgi:hypothetical protein